MKRIYVNYTYLSIIDLPDDADEDTVYMAIDNDMFEHSLPDYDDIEWEWVDVKDEEESEEA